MLPSRHQPRLALRRLLRRGCPHHRHLLPPELPGRHSKAHQHRVLPDSRNRSRARLSGVQAMPAGCLARVPRVGHPWRRRRPGDAPDQRWSRRPRGSERPRQAAALQRSAPQSRDHRRARGRAAGDRPSATGHDRTGAHRDVVDAVHGDRLRCWISQHPPVQRHRAGRVRGVAVAAAGGAATAQP